MEGQACASGGAGVFDSHIRFAKYSPILQFQLLPSHSMIPNDLRGNLLGTRPLSIAESSNSGASCAQQNQFDTFVDSLEIKHFQSISTGTHTITGKNDNFRLDMQKVSASFFSAMTVL